MNIRMFIRGCMIKNVSQYKSLMRHKKENVLKLINSYPLKEDAEDKLQQFLRMAIFQTRQLKY